MDVPGFRDLPLLGILRGIAEEDIEPLTECVIAAGLTAIEITMNTSGAPRLIETMVAIARGRLTVGAGTVCDLDSLRAARDAGASFIVSPTLIPAVVERCVRDDLPVFPGALTPREIHEAWTAGATMVKVFPASCFGPSYFKEIRGPFPQIPLLACGGVSAANMANYFASGAAAAAFGGSVFRVEWLRDRQYDRIGAEVRILVDACRAAAKK